MMGMQAEPARLFYDFRLDDHIPDDHLLRFDIRSPHIRNDRQVHLGIDRQQSEEARLRAVHGGRSDL